MAVLLKGKKGRLYASGGMLNDTDMKRRRNFDPKRMFLFLNEGLNDRCKSGGIEIHRTNVRRSGCRGSGVEWGDEIENVQDRKGGDLGEG